MKKFLAILMVIAMLALSFTVLAENDEREEPTRPIPGYAAGTYNGYSYSLDATQGSSSKIKSIGTYAIEATLTLKFKPTFTYTNLANGTTSFVADDDTLDCGPFWEDSLTKSYTVNQAAICFTVTVNGQQANLITVLGSDAHFSQCVYKLKINGTTKATITSNY